MNGPLNRVKNVEKVSPFVLLWCFLELLKSELERVLEVIYCSVTYKYSIVRGHLLLSSHCVPRAVLMITKRVIQRAVHKKKGVPAPLNDACGGV